MNDPSNTPDQAEAGLSSQEQAHLRRVIGSAVQAAVEQCYMHEYLLAKIAQRACSRQQDEGALQQIIAIRRAWDDEAESIAAVLERNLDELVWEIGGGLSDA